MCQISSVMATAEGPVAEFSGFANFEEKKRKSNLLMSFLKIVNQMGSFGQKRKKLFFRICRPILDIFGFTLLKGKANTHNNIKRGTCLKFAIDTLLSWLSNMFLRKMKNNCNQGGCFYSTFPTALLWLLYQVKLLY